jgi:hypothetical protein
MSQARHLAEEYYRRTMHPGPHNDDPWYHAHMVLLRDILTHLEVVLEDEEIPPGKVTRILRSLLYGSPHPADAVIRQQQPGNTSAPCRMRLR